MPNNIYLHLIVDKRTANQQIISLIIYLQIIMKSNILTSLFKIDLISGRDIDTVKFKVHHIEGLHIEVLYIYDMLHWWYVTSTVRYIDGIKH